MHKILLKSGFCKKGVEGLILFLTLAAFGPTAVSASSGPVWPNRLQELANLAEHVEPAELEAEIGDLANNVPDEDVVLALNLQLLPDTDAMRRRTRPDTSSHILLVR